MYHDHCANNNAPYKCHADRSISLPGDHNSPGAEQFGEQNEAQGPGHEKTFLSVAQLWVELNGLPEFRAYRCIWGSRPNAVSDFRAEFCNIPGASFFGERQPCFRSASRLRFGQDGVPEAVCVMPWGERRWVKPQRTI